MNDETNHPWHERSPQNLISDKARGDLTPIAFAPYLVPLSFVEQPLSSHPKQRTVTNGCHTHAKERKKKKEDFYKQSVEILFIAHKLNHDL